MDSLISLTNSTVVADYLMRNEPNEIFGANYLYNQHHIRSLNMSVYLMGQLTKSMFKQGLL